MKIYFIFFEGFPNGMATTHRTLCLCKAIQSQSIEVEVVLPRPSEPHYKSPSNTKHIGIHDNVPYYYPGGTPLRSSLFIKRRINDIVSFVKTLKYLKYQLVQNDIILVYGGSSFSSLFLVLLSYLCQTKIYKQIDELPYGHNKIRNNVSDSIKRIIYKHCVLRFYSGLIVISEELKKYTYLKNKPILKIPILIECTPQIRSNNLKKDYIVHIGTLTESKDGILGCIEAFGLACSNIPQGVRYYITGYIENSPHKKEILSILSKYEIDNRVVFLGYLSSEELCKLLSESKCAIINKIESIQNKYCFSTKLGEYLLNDVVVIATNYGEAMYYLKDSINSYIVPPGDILGLSRKICEVFLEQEKNNNIKKNGKELAMKAFDIKYNGEKLVNFFNKNNI